MTLGTTITMGLFEVVTFIDENVWKGAGFTRLGMTLSGGLVPCLIGYRKVVNDLQYRCQLREFAI
jgi:hypothetical protein